MTQPHPDHPELADLAQAGKVVAYFGFGSLVNRFTLRTSFLAIRRARIEGWRRLWLQRGDGSQTSLLSVVRAPGRVLQGVVVYDHVDNLPLVDEREAGYDRRRAERGSVLIDEPPTGDLDVFIYEGRLSRQDGAVAERGRVWQSYVDAVMQGYLSLFGEEGVRRFVDETDNFEIDIVGDRQRPFYPRPVELGPGEGDLFDRLLAERGARLVSLG